MTEELTAMEQAEARLTDRDRGILATVRSMFMLGDIDDRDLTAFLKDRLGFSSESAKEYVNAACDANDGDPT